MAKPRTPSSATAKKPAKSVKTDKPKTQNKRKPVPTPDKPVKSAATQPAPAAPTHNEIALKAYEIWIAKGRPIGQDGVNWEEARQALGG